jgi:hypothetical protein
MKFNSPDELHQFVTAVRRELGESRLPEAARRLANVQATVFTTSSEWLGELGAAVTQIRAEMEIPPALDNKLEIILTAVREAWPST